MKRCIGGGEVLTNYDLRVEREREREFILEILKVIHLLFLFWMYVYCSLTRAGRFQLKSFKNK